jgi:hypothetical protein
MILRAVKRAKNRKGARAGRPTVSTRAESHREKPNVPGEIQGPVIKQTRAKALPGSRAHASPEPRVSGGLMETQKR